MKTLIVLMAVLSIACYAQETEPDDAPRDQQVSAPAPLAGQRASRELLTERLSSSYLTGGIAVTQVFTDNAEMRSSGGTSDFSFSIQPHISIARLTPRLTATLAVFAGFVVNRHLNEQNQATQAVGLDVSYRVTQYTTLRLSDSFMNTTGLWSGTDAAPSSASGLGIGVLQQPNSSLFSFAPIMTNSALVELSRQFTRTSIGGIRVAHSFMWFPGSDTAATFGTLYDSQSYSVEAFYNHQFNLRHWAGVLLRARRFDVDRPLGRTDTVGVLFLYAFNIRPHVTISLFGGPESYNTPLPRGIPLPIVPFQRRMWSPTAGTVFSWQGQRTGVTASFVRQASNGGGVPSAVTLSSVDAGLRRQLSARLAFDVGFAYTQNVTIVTDQTFRTYSNHLLLTRHFGNNFTISAGYIRDDTTSLDSHIRASANRIATSFTYDFSRPLNR